MLLMLYRLPITDRAIKESRKPPTGHNCQVLELGVVAFAKDKRIVLDRTVNGKFLIQSHTELGIDIAGSKTYDIRAS